MTDPERWLTSEDAPPGMKELLVDARAAGPTAAQRAALGAKIGVASSAAWISPLIKVLAIGAAVAGGGLLYGTMISPDKAMAPVTVTVPKQHVTDISPVDESEEVPVAPDKDALPSSEPETTDEGKATAKVRAVKKPSEAQLLSQAKATLSSAPSKSLTLLAQHEKLYPNGVLAEEREVMKVRALQNTGRMEAAEKQAQEFRKSHPDSIHHVPTDK